MFFSYTASGVAILAFLFGLFDVLMGFAIGIGALGQVADNLSRYFPAYTTTGAVIDHGFMILFFSIVLGVLAEISFGLRKKDK